MLIKIVLVALVLYMIVNLFMAMRIMMKNDTSKGPMSKYIGRRVLTSATVSYTHLTLPTICSG